MSLHSYLRAETLASHEAVDAAFSAVGYDTRKQYVRFLAAQAGAVFPIEAALAPFIPKLAGMGVVWTPRAAALAQDLQQLGEPVKAMPDPLTIAGIEQALGTAYVLEGSRLGGRMLARRMRNVPELRDAPLSFLDYPAHPGFWQSFMDNLDAAPLDTSHWPLVLAGAESAFQMFLRSASNEFAKIETE